MKTKILDTPIIEDIRDLMTTGESIVWEGAPNPDASISILEIESKESMYRYETGGDHPILFVVLFIVTGIFLIYHGTFLSGFTLLSVGLGSIVLPEVLKRKRKENTKYYITSKRIIFELWWYGRKSIHQIEFSNLRNLIISKGNKNKGTIYLVVRNSKAIDFTTYCFSKGERRHQPTLEMVNNVDKIAQLIRENISKNMNP